MPKSKESALLFAHKNITAIYISASAHRDSFILLRAINSLKDLASSQGNCLCNIYVRSNTHAY